MFTGIIRKCGEVAHLSFDRPMAQLHLETTLDVSDIQPGDSIAVNGVCLTIVKLEKGERSILHFDLGPETLQCTSLGSLRPTQCVHIEKSMLLNERINGHLLSGHIDGIGTVIHKEKLGDSLILKIAAPSNVLQFCVKKGSIAVDGVSLTINKVQSDSFELCLIPHTLQLTNFDKYDVGAHVNLENDMIGKYVFEYIGKSKKSDSGSASDLLENNGFVNANRNHGYPL